MEQEPTRHPDYPEEYITGKVNFFGRDFIVTPDVLIPRLETEGLVRRARNMLCSPPFRGSERGYLESTPPSLPYKGRNITIVDIGCGSGIIGVSCADLADEVIFLDISPEALEVAEKNFRTHFPEKKAQFIVSDLLEKFLISHPEKGEGEGVLFQKSEQTLPNPPFSGRGGENTLLLTNLPYIKGGDWGNMSADTHFEPELALFGGGETGFEMYERLFEQLRDQSKIPLTPFLKGESNRTAIRLIIEFGFDQREIAEKIIKNYGWKYEFFADYAGVERFCEIELTNY